MSASIAVLGGLIQIAAKPENLGKTLKIRIVMAVVLSIVGIALLARQLTDIYPFISVVVSRFAELSSRTIIIRLGFFISGIPWLFYNWSNGFYLATLYTSSLMVAILIGIYRNDRNVKKEQIS